MAFADKREYAYWLDQSGNNNDWTSNNLTESDVMVDSPTNNFATLNPLVKTTTVLSEGNLKAAYTTGGDSVAVSSFALTGTGKYYCEFLNQVNNEGGVGIYADISDNLLWVGVNGEGSGHSMQYRFNGLTYINGASNGASMAATSSGDIIGMAYDAGSGKFFLSRNGTFVANNAGNTGNPATGANPLFTIDSPYDAFFAFGMDATSGGVFNFGQDSSFAGNKTAQGNQDGNSIGDFYYAPPTGFLALCTSNLPAVAVVPSENFNTVLWTGNDTDNRSITGVGFQPDFTWNKARNRAGGDGFYLYDAVRGATKVLYSNATAAEATEGNALQAFESDGFQMGNDSNSNSSSYNYVAWNWKANGSGSSNTAGSINSTVSANADAGFSIVSYTGNVTAGATVGHGLSKAPEMIITKSRAGTTGWLVGHNSLTNWTYSLALNTTGATWSENPIWNSTAPSSTVFTLGSDTFGNSANTRIAYCFHSVDGYSKVGSYTGNDAADGAFVYTGFTPKFILFKNIERAGQDWGIYDSVRHTYNPLGDRLLANSSAAEEANTDNIDFVSNGFKWRDNSYINNYTETYIYIAFAETPFKYSNAQ
jgi:hypothetical protein